MFGLNMTLVLIPLKAISLYRLSNGNSNDTRIFENTSVNLLIHGNWSQRSADHIITRAKQVFDGKLPQNNRIEIPCLDLQSIGPLTLPMELPEHNHATLLYYPHTK